MPEVKTGSHDASRARFDTTRWSLVAAAGSEHSQVADEALNELCRAYWRPIYAEIRRRGRDVADAQDLAQEFFACLLRRGSLGLANRKKGRFRTYLLGSLDYFLVNEWRGKQALKRGGGVAVLPLSGAEDEKWFQHQQSTASSPADAFDQNWALVLMDRALAALRAEYEESGRHELFQVVEPFLTADSGEDGYASVCGQIGLTPQAFAVAVHRLRRRFRHCVREQVEMTVADSSDVDAELKHLFGL